MIYENQARGWEFHVIDDIDEVTERIISDNQNIRLDIFL